MMEFEYGMDRSNVRKLIVALTKMGRPPRIVPHNKFWFWNKPSNEDIMRISETMLNIIASDDQYLRNEILMAQKDIRREREKENARRITEQQTARVRMMQGKPPLDRKWFVRPSLGLSFPERVVSDLRREIESRWIAEDVNKDRLEKRKRRR